MKHSRTLSTLAVLALLSACADINDTGLAALATRVQAYAVVNEQLVQGEMTLYTDRTGTVALRFEVAKPVNDNPFEFSSPAKPVESPVERPILNSCLGRFRYTATTYGVIDLRCNEGSTAELRMALIGETRGYGYGQTATGLASLTFGMAPTEARAHLTAPPGKQLLEANGVSGLEMR
ncbi:MAG: hypothetical protein V4627_12000 [Pseudomonadota bacterium]